MRFFLAAESRSAMSRWYSSMPPPGGAAPKDMWPPWVEAPSAPSGRSRKPYFAVKGKLSSSRAQRGCAAAVQSSPLPAAALLLPDLLGEQRPRVQVVQRHLQLIVV